MGHTIVEYLVTNSDSIILVHDFRRYTHLGQVLRNTVERTAANGGNATPGIQKFGFNADDIFQRGETAFLEIYEAFSELIYRRTVSHAKFYHRSAQCLTRRK